jgi:hypothetical protein
MRGSEHAVSAGPRVMPKVMGVVFGGCTIAMVVWIVRFAATFDLELLPTTVETHKLDALAFHKQRTAGFLSLPKEAHILEVKWTQVWVDASYEIRFTLPRTRSPHGWLKHIWQQNNFAPGSQERPFLYSAYHTSSPEPHTTHKRSDLHHGHRSLEYLPAEQIYQAEIGTD